MSDAPELHRLVAALDRSESEYARLLQEVEQDNERAAREVGHVLDAITDARAALSRLAPA